MEDERAGADHLVGPRFALIGDETGACRQRQRTRAQDRSEPTCRLVEPGGRCVGLDKCAGGGGSVAPNGPLQRLASRL